MAAPHVCLSCRAKLLLPRLRQSRLVSYTVADRSVSRNRNNAFDTLLDGSDPAPTRARTDEPRNSAMRGRYSGKELRPEQLLHAANAPEPVRQSRGAVQFVRNLYNPNADRSRPADVQRLRTEMLPKPLRNKLETFLEFAKGKDFARAWDVLRAAGELCAQVPFKQLNFLASGGEFPRAVHNLSTVVTYRWLDFLSKGISLEGVTSPMELLSTLRLFRAPKSYLYGPALQRITLGIFESNLDSEQLVTALKELVRMWRISMAARLAPPQDPEGEGSEQHGQDRHMLFKIDDELDWGFLPSTTVFASTPTEDRNHHMFNRLLNMLLPTMHNDMGSRGYDGTRPLASGRWDFATPALITLDILRSALPSKSESAGSDDLFSHLPHALPLMQLLETMLDASPAPSVPYTLRQKLNTLPEDSELRQKYLSACYRLNLHGIGDTEATKKLSPSYVLSETHRGSSSADNETADSDNVKPDADSAQPQQSRIEQFSLKNNTRLGRAVEQSNISMVEKIHREIYAFAATQGDASTALPLELYEVLMHSYMSVRNLQKAVEIWRDIVKAGYKPTTKTYTVMMRGASFCRDVRGMEAFWQSMRQNGLQPDEHAWSVRVFGLLKQRQSLAQGLQALGEMSREWIAAAKTASALQTSDTKKKQAVADTIPTSTLVAKFPGPVNSVPRPNLVVMNAAIAALAKHHDKEIPKVLLWGRSFGLEPDLVTYNALLNLAMRNDQVEEAMKILQRMHAHGVQADGSTWTVLLTALFQGGFLEDLGPAEQQEKIISFIDSVQREEFGIKGIDEKSYALIIDRLLKTYSNPTAANAVLTHMTKRGLEPTTQIYTILMTSYFQQQPQPDFAAIEMLWKQIQSRNNGWSAPVDSVFYDRMIEGYASFHHLAGIQPALEYLKRARRAGQKPSWKALEALARALAERSDWQRLKALVNDVRASLSDARNATQHFGQRSFWEFIIETGLFRDQGIQRPEQLLPAQARDSPMVDAANAY